MTWLTPNFNSAERMDIYRSMFLLNRGFHFIVQRLEHVGKIMMKDRDLRDMLGMTQEIQLEINTLVLNNLDSVENNNVGRSSARSALLWKNDSKRRRQSESENLKIHLQPEPPSQGGSAPVSSILGKTITFVPCAPTNKVACRRIRAIDSPCNAA